MCVCVCVCVCVLFKLPRACHIYKKKNKGREASNVASSKLKIFVGKGREKKSN